MRKGINVFIGVGLKILRWRTNTETEVHSEKMPIYTYYFGNSFLIIKKYVILYQPPPPKCRQSHAQPNFMLNVKRYTKDINNLANNLFYLWVLCCLHWRCVTVWHLHLQRRQHTNHEKVHNTTQKIKERKAHNNCSHKTSNNNRRKTKDSTAHSSITTTLMD
jgi:hypothetical protein